MKYHIENDILILHYKHINLMNKELNIISDSYEGQISNRIGHNFPSNFIPNNHILSKFKKKCKYVIAVTNFINLKHEKLHAKYYLDNEYRKSILKEWDLLEENVRNHIIFFLKKLGYSDDVIIDEYQAYKYSEKKNFFGINL